MQLFFRGGKKVWTRPDAAQVGDIVFTGENFGCGSSRQQAVDCFKSLGISAIIAPSFRAIYERNAVNAAFPVLTYDGNTDNLPVKDGEIVLIDLLTGEVKKSDGTSLLNCNPFSEVQMNIFERGGLLAKT